MEKYRIDYATSQIFELNTDDNAYDFLCTFNQIGATNKNKESTIVRKIEALKEYANLSGYADECMGCVESADCVDCLNYADCMACLEYEID